MATFIVTIFKSTYLKPPQLTTTRKIRLLTTAIANQNRPTVLSKGSIFKPTVKANDASNDEGYMQNQGSYRGTLPSSKHVTIRRRTCERILQEVLGFSNVISSGNPTLYYDPIVSTSSPTLTPFGDSDFLFYEEDDSFLLLEDDSNSPEVDPTYYEP
ncbi:hypothetical protein Tco_0448741 [Tanacetum coccineum]